MKPGSRSLPSIFALRQIAGKWWIVTATQPAFPHPFERRRLSGLPRGMARRRQRRIIAGKAKP
jgi:hypothetical protein